MQKKCSKNFASYSYKLYESFRHRSFLVHFEIFFREAIFRDTFQTATLRKKCPYSELFWFVFSHIRTEYGQIRSISSYSVRMPENTDQNNSEYGHFSCSAALEKMFLSRKFCKYTEYYTTERN